MIGKNNFLKQDSNPNMEGAIISSGPAPATPPPTPPAQPSATVNETPQTATVKEKSDKKLLVVGSCCLLAGLLIATVIYFVFLRPKSESSEDDMGVTTYSSEIVDSKSTEEIVEDYDRAISETTDDAEKFTNTLDKATFYVLTDDYDSAIKVAEGISTQSLSDYDLYRLYNLLVSAYQGKEDSAQAEKYQKLADEALARDYNTSSEVEE